MGNCSSTSNCNPCGPDFNAINQLATKAGAYARQANTYSVDAANSATNAENAFLEFNALYLGAFAVAPTVDNEGDPLQTGALYWNSILNTLFTWNSVAWVPSVATEIYLGGFAIAPATNNDGDPLQLGNLYWNSVTNDLWAYDGAAWGVVDFNEFTPFLATGTTTARNLVTRFSDYINVKDFGAIGDGVTNDTAAIQAAIAFAALQSFPQVIFFPEGKYITSTLPEINSNLTTSGVGMIQNGSQWISATDYSNYSNFSNVGLSVFFTGATNSDLTPKRQISLFTTTNGKNFSKLNCYPISDLNGTPLDGSDPSIVYINDTYYIAVGVYVTDQYDLTIYSSKNLVEWETHRCKLGTGIHITNGTAPGYGTTFLTGPQIWAPEWYVDTNGNIYIIVSIQAGPNVNDVDGNTEQFMRPYISLCTDINALTFAPPTELNLGGTSLPIPSPTLTKFDGSIGKIGNSYYLFNCNAYEKKIEYWTSTNLFGAWTNLGIMAFPKYTEAPSLVNLKTQSGTSWFLYADNWKQEMQYYAQSFNLVSFSAPERVNTTTRIRHGTTINLPESPNNTINKLLLTSALIKGSYDPLAYGVAKAWVVYYQPPQAFLNPGYNISSVTKTAVGIYEVNLIEPILPVTPCILVGTDTVAVGAHSYKAVAISTTKIQISIYDSGTTNYADPDIFYVTIFGN
jgi:hypothetical protein